MFVLFLPAFLVSMENKEADSNCIVPPAKKRKVSLSLRKPLEESNSSRFASPTKSDQLHRAAEGVVPTNTRNSTNWAVRTFLLWVEERNKRETQRKIEQDILSCNSADRVSFVMRLFVMEVRKADGGKYPPATIRNLLSGLNREMMKNKVEFSIMDKVDRRFRELHLTLDSVCSELHRTGVGVTRNSARVILTEDEALFWEKGLLGTSSPIVLQHTVFFYVGMQFVLRGVQEQHDLCISQFVRHPADHGIYSAEVCYEYTEYISKNNQHRFKDSKAKNKVVKAYARPGSERCVVKLLDRYLPLLPVGSTYFYLRPCKCFPSDVSQLAYCRQRVGINQLKKIISTVSSTSGTSGYTNHSLRATAMTRMYNQGVPEKIIAEKSGHRSLDGLRAYEHPSTKLEKAAGHIIADPTKDFKEEVKQESQQTSLLKEDSVHAIPGFSGNMANCTFHFNIGYRKN